MELVDEKGEALLPLFEGVRLDYQQPAGHGEGQLSSQNEDCTFRAIPQTNEKGETVLPGFDTVNFPVEYQYIPGVGTGQLSSQACDWYTHPDVVALVHELYDGPPDLDPMSCAEANQVVQAGKYYDAEMDGLVHPWYGRMLWNPPWGGASESAVKKRGLKKLLDAYHNGDVTECVCVLNANAITTKWFAPLLEFPVCIPPYRIAHYGPGGKGGAPNSGTIIVYVSDPYKWDRFSDVFGRLGKIMWPH